MVKKLRSNFPHGSSPWAVRRAQWRALGISEADMEKPKIAIVNTSSVAGLTGTVFHPAYSAAKHGVLGITKSAALQYARNGIRINAVCPGAVRTPMVESVIAVKPKYETINIAAEPVGRMADPEEIAHAAVWLCTDKASFVTGHAMAVDGGMLAH